MTGAYLEEKKVSKLDSILLKLERIEKQLAKIEIATKLSKALTRDQISFEGED